MGVDRRNPSFPRAIPHGTAIIDLLLKVVFFGLFPGSRRAHSPVGEWGGSGDRSRISLRANWTPVGIDINPKVSSLDPNFIGKRELDLELDLKLELELDPHPKLDLELELDL